MEGHSMTPQQQRIAIAESQGLTDREWICANGEWCFSDLVPNYCDDLNAMHEAEKMLEADDNHAYGCYCSNLYEKYGNTVSLTAAQRAEAFLRTIGEWTTNPNEL